MKKLFFAITIFCSSFIFSQDIPKDAYVITEQVAEFPDGGVQNFRNLILNNFRTEKIQGTGNESCEIKFVIDQNGFIRDVQALGTNEIFNKEAIRAVAKIKTKWIPAKINGQSVRYKMRIPLYMIFN